MELDTKYFGGIRCDDGDILQFPEGIFGFEDQKRFLLMPFEGGDGSLLCFQSISTPQLAFVAMDPFRLYPDYAPVISGKDLRILGAKHSTDLCYYSFCVVKSPISNSTVNLKCPVAINDVSRVAKQVMLEEYQMRHLLSEFSKKEGSPC